MGLARSNYKQQDSKFYTLVVSLTEFLKFLSFLFLEGVTERQQETNKPRPITLRELALLEMVQNIRHVNLHINNLRKQTPLPVCVEPLFIVN